MKNMTRAERARLTAAVLYPENESATLGLRQVADMTNRDIRVVRHFVRKGVLPAKKNSAGEYEVEARHVAIVLFQPARYETRKLNRRLQQTVVPGTTPEETIG